MKSYTITCHNVYNYGASLQAYALQKYLDYSEIDNLIIDYRPDYLDWHYKLSWWISPRSRYYSILTKIPFLRFFYVLCRFFKEIRSFRRKQSFDGFTKKYLNRTKIVKNLEDVNEEFFNAELLITGSDQVWNSINLDNGLDPVFYLNFGKESIKRISYAASFGGSEVYKLEENRIRKMLHMLDSISVRESSGIDIIKKFGLTGKLVCDPVLLLSEKQWENAFDNVEFDEKYILIYNLSKSNESLLKCANTLKKQANIKIYSIYNQTHISSDKEFLNADPSMFVHLINNAECVVTNSFHASVFSVIFKKDFYSFSDKKKNSARISNFLNLLGLEDRYNSTIFDFNAHIDYEKVNPILNDFIERSKEWLNSQLNI